ncbi:hypothetical protein IWW37_001547 [Coemansia sp. RSA 2050]|nr:hypothetical protein IWW37_001547 [Coemansia sp. RSA 2050]KAJ2734831.1 hypothetical protein IW152_002049 [Coemansia sp. BCRC 34962]
MSCKIFVGSIPWSVESSRLAEIFGEFGNVVDSKVITDRETGRSRGFGFVTFSCEDEARKAIEHGQNMEIDERKISVNSANEQENRPSRPRFNNNRSYQGQEGGNYHQQQQQQQDSGEYDNQAQGGNYFGTYGRRNGYGGGRGGRANPRQEGSFRSNNYNAGGYNNNNGGYNNRQHQYDGGNRQDGGYSNYGGGQQQQQQPYGGGDQV